MLSMNYVGGSAILDRGDGPAQAILDKNARSLAQRVANETKEELEKVMNRVENIYDSYESSTQAFFETQASMEYVDDIAELEELIKDSIKKKKYQQQITIFIVGYENVCGQKLRLLQQVNEFFMDNTRKEDEEDLPPPSPDIDVEDCSNKIEESLETAKHLADRLAEINSDIVDWLTNYAINKASTKAIALVDAKGKKKLESALSKAKEDMKTVTEQLKAAQAASEEKDDLVQLYLKQLEGKSLEIQKFKTAAEVAKKTIVQLEEDLDMNQVNLSAKQERIKQLSNELKKAQLDVSQSNYLSNLNENRAQEKDKEFMDFSVFKVRLEELQNQLERNKFDMEAKKRELQNAHEDQMRELLQSHKQELETLRADNETQINQLKGISQDSHMLDKESTQITEEEVEKEESKESRPSTKTNKAQGPPKVAVRTNQQKNIPPKSTAIKNEAKVSTKPVKETAEPEPIEEHVPEKPAAKKTGRSVETISDAGDNFNDNFDLNDEQAWTSIPSDQVTTRFSQYRKLAKKRLEEMEEQLNITMTKTQRKVSTLKSQFHEHKSKWEAERKVLVEQVEQAQKLQNEAEKEADVAMTQLEEFINEQERLEEEEEVKRQEVVKGVSRPIPIPSVELEEEKSKSSLLTPQEKTTPEDASSDVEAVAKEIVDEADGAAPTQPSQPDAELSNLMQQTDDAKYERQKTDHVTSQSRSVRSSSLSSDVAPWLMSSSNPQKSSPEDESEDDEEELEDEVIEPPPKAMSKASIRSKAEKIAKERSQTLSATDDIKSGSRKSKSGLSSKLSKEESSSSSLRRRETTDGSKSEERDPDYMDDRAKSGKQSSSSPYSEKHSDQKESRKSSLTVEAVETSRSHSLRSRKKSSSTEETQEDKRSRSRSTRNRSRSNSRTTGKSPMTVEDIEDVEGMKSARSVPRSRKHSSEPVFEEEMEGHSSRPLMGSASHSRVSRQSIQHPSRKPSHISNQDQLSGEPTVFNSEDYEEDPFIEVNVRGKQSSRAFSRTSQGQVTPFRSFSEQVQEMNSRITSGAMSAPPEMDALSRSHSEFKEAQKREGTQTSLKSLPALDTLLWSSQSQRLVTSQQKSGLASSLESASKSAPLDKLALHMARSSISQKLESADKSFATVATDGSFVKDLSLTPVSRSVTLQKQLSRVTESRAGAVQEEADTLDGDHDNRIYKLDKACSPMTELYTTPIHGKTEDEIHLSSSMSRASLRNQYKNKLEEVRAAVEDRRAKSPAVSIPSQRSLEEDQLIDEDDGATGRAATDEAKEKRETSKLSRQKTERLKANHPAVGEFLKTYQGIVQFKEAISKLMVDREMLQPGQIVSDLETLEFDPEAHVEPQLEYMSRNVYKVLEEILTVLGTILLADREPNISSLSHVAASREPSQFPQREKSADSGRGPTTTRASQYSNKSSDLDKQALQELQEQYQKLQQELTAQAKKHEDQLRHNTVVMMEMQDTINELHRELSNLGRSSSRLRPQSDANSAQGTESSVMFTRLDSERNAKIMKRAVNEQKLAPETYKDAVNKMDDYVSLPAERLAHLVRKYVHHCRMKQIEDNVKKSRSLNENVFDILDKMEALQNQRAKRWADSMDEMGSERARLAALLMQTLESIEQESGIFLIKPMYSYRGRAIYNRGKDISFSGDTSDLQSSSSSIIKPMYSYRRREITERLGGKLARPNRPRHASPKRESINVSQNAPAPTPSHNTKGLRTYGQSQQVGDGYLPFAHSNQPLEGDQQGIMGNSMMWAGGATPNKQTWSMNASIVRGDPESFLSSQNPNLMNTPRILELDINRMMIGQNNISSKVLPTSLSDDRLINAAQNNLRSYVTVNRPTANQSGLTTNRPSSYGSSLLKEGVLPSSPINQSQGRARTSDPDLSRNMTNTPPLPPISTHSNNVRETPAEPPRSPPGSSIRVSPPRLVCL